MEEIKILYLVRSSEFGGFTHVSEKETLEESDAMDAKLVLAIHQHDSLQCLSRNKLRVTIRAINKLQKMSLQVTLVSSDDGERNNLILCNVKTPYGYCWFKLKNFNNGFIGGASGFISKDTILFTGNIKLHPEYQGFYVDDEKMKPIYKKISSLGLITIFHAGYDYGYPPPYHCMPDNLLNALKWFDSPVIAAHWGGVSCGVEVINKLCGRDIFFDLSFGYGTMPKAIAEEIVNKHTPDKLLFASDMPWHRPAWEKQLIETLDLSDKDKDKIYYKNAMKLLNISRE